MKNHGDATSEQRDSITKLLCDELEKGLSIRVACDKVGITDSAIYRWKRKAEQGDDEAIQLMRRLMAARARGLDEHRGLIKLAAEQGDWRAAAWLIDKLYPDLRPEEFVLNLEQDDQLAEQYADPAKVVQLCKWAVQAGLVTIEELTGIAPQPKPAAAAIEPAQPQADSLMHVMQTVVVALSAGDREQRELQATVCKVLRCEPGQFDDACSRLAVEVVAQQGQKTMLRRPNPVSARQNDVASTTAEIRTEPAGSQPSDRPTVRGNWFDGPARGTGDVIRERRGG